MSKISQYPALTVPVPGDQLPIVDISTGTTKNVTISRLMASFGGWFNVQSYGAAGNGSTDDTAAIAAAVTAAQAVHGVVYLPAGTYAISFTPFLPGAGTGAYSITGDGPAATIIKPTAGFAGSYAVDLTFTVTAATVQVRDLMVDLTNKKTLNGIRIGNSTAGQQAHHSLVENVVTLYGADGVTLEGSSNSFSVRHCHMRNASNSGVHITNSYATSQPNGELSWVEVYNTDAAVTTANGVLIDTFMTGLAMDNVRVLSAGQTISRGITYNTGAPTGSNGAFFQATNCITDACTVAGLSLTNCRQFQSSNNFWSALNSTGAFGVTINGGVYFRFVNDEISACGVQYTNAPDDIAFTCCEFPATGTTAGVQNMPGSSPPTRIQIDSQSLEAKMGGGYQLTNNLAALQTALVDPTAIGMTRYAVTNGPLFETFPAAQAASNGTVMLTGNLYFARIWLPRGVPVTNIVWCSGSSVYAAGTGIHYWGALYATGAGIATGAPLGQSADNIAPTIAANTVQVLPLAASFVTTYSGAHYIGICLSQTGGTLPGLLGYSGLSAVNNLTPKTAYLVTGITSGTAPTNPGTGAALAVSLWAGIS